MRDIATNITHLDNPHVALVPGYRASGVACGLKPDGALDLALVAADVPCVAAAVFTTNCIQAAPVLYDRDLLRAGRPAQAVIINSGCANACTGKRGLQDVEQMAALASRALHIAEGATFVMSTGVIGQHLPMEKIGVGIAEACRTLSTDGGHAAARAIMTTDTCPKEAAAQAAIGDRQISIAGMCKGAGMLHPNMATMLGLLVTDIAISPSALQVALEQAVEQTFNMVTVDGDTSTNDTVVLLANGYAGNPVVTGPDSPGFRAFLDGLVDVSTTLAQGLVRDGEGASKFVTVQVTGASDFASAKQVAQSIATSSLVKTAVYGEDANWGRVLCAAGYSGVEIDPLRLSLWMKNDIDVLHLVKDGEPFEIDEPRAAQILAQDEVTFQLDLGQGDAKATVWTCDLTHAYVDINAHYRT
jgi:glutamate N-acetyltransferase/amino-acid N-acetyltransferase